jgi:bifunctional UDP-N-acetylglucosamine pyrophosphorylase/glucosamine-1-phosphate N-acetyltransferase
MPKKGKVTASVILAAGRGSRMSGYGGNKTLLPLLPSGASPWEGRRPILFHILEQLPPGPKAVVVHHRQEEVMAATGGLGLVYCRQPVLNGTGGALLSARRFLETVPFDDLIITMGDVPLVLSSTYASLVRSLGETPFVVLGFRPASKLRYGLLEITGDRVDRITEWTYWSRYPQEKLRSLEVCNAGIYAARGDVLLKYLPVLASRPHRVEKTVQGKPTLMEEYFITDLVEYLRDDGLPVGYLVVEREEEVMGVDDPVALRKAQQIYGEEMRKRPP